MSPNTLIIDRRFRGVGRIKRASGTTRPAVFRQFNEMLDDLADQGRADLLLAIKRGKLDIRVVFNAWRARRLDQLAPGMGELLAATMRAWIDGRADVSQNHRWQLISACRRMQAQRPAALVSDIADVLRVLRASYGALHPRSFNLTKLACQAFVRAQFGRRSNLYLDVGDVDSLTVPKSTKRHPLTVAQLRNWFPSPQTDWVDAAAWTMATTGMGQKELWGAWHAEKDRVHIEGTKRAGRVRDVPLVIPPVVPSHPRSTFDARVRERCKSVIRPYDLRRTYANLLVMAGVPANRRRIYMGHEAKSVTDLYEWHEVAAYLSEDAAKMRAVLAPRSTKRSTIRLESHR